MRVVLPFVFLSADHFCKGSASQALRFMCMAIQPAAPQFVRDAELAIGVVEFFSRDICGPASFQLGRDKGLDRLAAPDQILDPLVLVGAEREPFFLLEFLPMFDRTFDHPGKDSFAFFSEDLFFKVLNDFRGIGAFRRKLDDREASPPYAFIAG